MTNEILFECAADGYQPETFKYQWIFNGTNVSGAINKMLRIPSVSEDNDGMYQCIVTNPWNIVARSTPARAIISSND